MSLFLDTLKQGKVVLLDGAMGTMIQDLTLTDADFGGGEFKMLSDLLTFSKPHELKEIHLKYFRAGANAVETNTFGASRLRLKEYDFSRLNLTQFEGLPRVDITKIDYDTFAYELNKSAALIARSALAEHKKDKDYDGRPLFVVGSIGPSNWVLSSTKANLNRGTYALIMENFYHQVLGLIDGGADVLLFETQQDILELKAAIHGAQKAMREKGVKLPIMSQVTVDQFGKMQIFNTDILAALTTLENIGIDVFGINCSIGPDLMRKTVERICAYAGTFVSIIPNAGLPVSENGKTVFKFSPEDFAGHVKSFVTDFGVNIIGGCCGTRPAHIQAVRAALKGITPKKREPNKMVRISGPQNAIFLDSSKSLIRIGERLNVRGSQKVRVAVESGGAIDFDALEEVVNEQVRDLGLDVIDVCMDSNLVNTEDTLVKVIDHATTDFKAAMCIDSFSVQALLRAIEVYPGRPILNSISLEEYEKGVDKIDAVVSQTWQHGPVYVALCTDQTGPAVTAEAKADFARRIYEKCRDKYGIRADQLIVDVNAFPIGAESVVGMNFTMESINSIPLIKKIHPDLMVSMGVGNLTNGLAKKPYMRKVLTSVFMEIARKAGMDAAIINPDHYVPVESLDVGDVELARRVIELCDMDAFSRLEEIAEERKGGKAIKRCSYEDLPLEAAICQKIKDGFKQKQPGKIELNDFEYEYNDAIVVQVAEALKKHNPLDFINLHLMASMKDLGDGFARGEVSLPHLLKSADVMKSCMGFIETYMKFKSGTNIHDEIQYKGTVVIGTVYQDVHSIGKDLVKTLLENYGYRVIDLGVQTALEKFIDTAKQYKAHAIGMSALLVQTSNHMITVARMVREAGLNVDLLIGGAPVNNRHASYVSMHGQSDDAQLMPNVFYCPSGMDGVNVMNQLRESPESRERMVSENREKLVWHYAQAVLQSQKDSDLLKTLPRRQISLNGIKRTSAQIIKSKKIQMTLADFASHLDLKTLFSLNWRFGGKNSWQKKGETESSLKERLADWIERCDQNKWIVPQAVCAVLPCYRDNDHVVILDESHREEVKGRRGDLSEKIDFTVVIAGDKKEIFSAAQYYSTQAEAEFDLIGLQISTAGPDVDKQVQKFKEEGDAESALLLQGLSDRVAEDMAEYTHSYLREKMGLNKGDGTRYSPGYPGLKDVNINALIAKLLDAQTNLKISLTDAGEFYPTGTTGAVVCFHPLARYD